VIGDFVLDSCVLSPWMTLLFIDGKCPYRSNWRLCSWA